MCLSKWEYAREMVWVWWRWRQFSDEMAATITGPVSEWFLFMVYVKGLVYVPPFPDSIHELAQKITSALDNVTGDMQQRVWHEFNNRLDVYGVTGDAHIEHLWNRSQNKLMFNIKTFQFHWASLSFQDNCFWNDVKFLGTPYVYI